MVMVSKQALSTKATIVGSTASHVVLLIKKKDLAFKCIPSKEATVKLHLKQWARNGRIPRYTSHNKKIEGCNARPDFVWHMPTHAVVVEVDEFQHSQKFSQSGAYKPKKEFQRMCGLSLAIGKPVVIIRYNPDAFKIAGVPCRTSKSDRMSLLLERLQLAMISPPSACITAEYLFYSRVQQSEGLGPFIGHFSFPEHYCMTDWIDTLGASWETLTLGEAVEIAEDTTGTPQKYNPPYQADDGAAYINVAFKQTAADIVLHAHQNLNLLYCNGQCFEEALAYMVTVNVWQSVVNAIQNTSHLVHIVTGESNPFKLAQKIYSEEEISRRLQCQLIKIPCKSKKGTKEELCLSPAKKQEFVAIVRTWLNCNPRMYHLYSMPGEGLLTMMKAIHILDRVLEIMFDMRFTTHEKSIRQPREDGRRRVYSYGARESSKIISPWSQ